MDARDLLAACLAFEEEHGAACLIIALYELIDIRAEASGIELSEDEDGHVDYVLPTLQ